MNLIAEIGINHNGSVETCKEMMNICSNIGCRYVKIQKRNPDVCVPEHQKNILRETPWGKMKYIDYKKRIEFSEAEIKELVEYGDQLELIFFASVWDLDSARLMSKYTKIAKLGSASITDENLCNLTRELFDFVIISTGMSTEEEIEKAVKDSSPDVIMHTNSTYPCPPDELNLRYIEHLKQKYPSKAIGYSGHEQKLSTTIAAQVLGVSWIERHFTLDKTMWGSDHSSSIDPTELKELIQSVKDVEDAMQYPPGPRKQFEKESIKKRSLRKR